MANSVTGGGGGVSTFGHAPCKLGSTRVKQLLAQALAVPCFRCLAWSTQDFCETPQLDQSLLESLQGSTNQPVEACPTWRFMGSYKRGYKSPNIGYRYSYPTYNPIHSYPCNEPPSTVVGLSYYWIRGYRYGFRRRDTKAKNLNPRPTLNPKPQTLNPKPLNP